MSEAIESDLKVSKPRTGSALVVRPYCAMCGEKKGNDGLELFDDGELSCKDCGDTLFESVQSLSKPDFCAHVELSRREDVKFLNSNEGNDMGFEPNKKLSPESPLSEMGTDPSDRDISLMEAAYEFLEQSGLYDRGHYFRKLRCQGRNKWFPTMTNSGKAYYMDRFKKYGISPDEENRVTLDEHLAVSLLCGYIDPEDVGSASWAQGF